MLCSDSCCIVCVLDINVCFAEETSAAEAQTDLNINETCSVQSSCGSFSCFFIVL